MQQKQGRRILKVNKLRIMRIKLQVGTRGVLTHLKNLLIIITKNMVLKLGHQIKRSIYVKLKNLLKLQERTLQKAKYQEKWKVS
jgi:hypothetical protein